MLSLWWKEYAECSEGPRPQLNSKKKSVKQSIETPSESSVSSSLYEVEEERVGVPVKGGLYEVPSCRDLKNVLEVSCKFNMLSH